MENENTLVYLKTSFGVIELVEEVEKFSRNSKSYRLYLDDGLQWDSSDEYRYHQSLFAMPFLFLPKEGKKDVLVLGGGDGLGVRELWTNFEKEINSVTLVDISKEMLFLAKNNEIFTELNKNSLNHPKITIINDDAQNFVEKTNQKFDVIILDYPDPVAYDSPVNELFSALHYKKVSKLLNTDGIMALQATSVFITPNLFRKLQIEISKVFSNHKRVKVDINSYGDIGVIFASNANIEFKREIPENLFFSNHSLSRLFTLFKDEQPFFDDEVLDELNIKEIVQVDIKEKGIK